MYAAKENRPNNNSAESRAVGKAAVGNLVVQPKLTIGNPGDVYEQEADATADRVMKMPEQNFIQRKCTNCKEEEDSKVQKKSLSDTIQRKASDGATMISDGVGSKIQATKGSGMSIDPGTKNFMETRFGSDFGNVKIHTGEESVQMNQQLGARAFTTGNDVYFNKNQYNPDSSEGKHLLAHELTHTIQQGNGGNKVQRMLEVNPGVKLDMMGFSHLKIGNVYDNAKVVKNSIFNETFTSLLFSDRTFKIAGTTSAQANANLQKHIAARIGIVDFASKKKYSFGAGAKFEMNPDFWVVDHARGSFDPKPGIERQKAIEDLNVHPSKYKIACQAATALTVEGGGKASFTSGSSSTDTDWIPGDWGYIVNSKFPRPGGKPGLEGENIIYTGKDMFWGHFGSGVEYKTLQEWFDLVDSWHHGAVITDSRKYTKAGLE